MQVLPAVVTAVFPVLVVHAAVTDFFSMTISNRVSIGLFAVGLAAVALTAGSPAEVGAHFAAAGVVFAIGFACFAFGWMGGGDVKFAAAVAFWLGWPHMLDFGLAVSIFGGGLTLLVLASDRLLDPLPVLKFGFLARFHEHRRVPYGIALSAAGLQIFSQSDWMRVFL
ncbi:peptidase [Siculibacillus lacustris]|uniref:Peptidase n=2 Tax=Siculibacillus lacustris TaxID=1549641 RepID=A0A4Q9VT58_9HYPH|nr:peptidase [Siculibacillus lacustris]